LQAEFCPSKGTILEATSDRTVHGLIQWRAPITTDFEAVAPTDTRVVVNRIPVASATASNCSPLDYNGLERVLVSEEDRISEGYAGYVIILPFADIQTGWRVV
jgi:hypothetical protein